MLVVLVEPRPGTIAPLNCGAYHVTNSTAPIAAAAAAASEIVVRGLVVPTTY
jgi:hypothetical protein